MFCQYFFLSNPKNIFFLSNLSGNISSKGFFLKKFYRITLKITEDYDDTMSKECVI